MDEWRRWAVTVCTAAVVCTLCSRLFPDNSLGRQGRMLLPCVFLCVLLSPLLSLTSVTPAPSVTYTQSSGAALELRMRQQLVTRVNDTLLEMVNQALASYGMSVKKVATDMDIDENGCIGIEHIVLYVDENTAQRSILVKQVAEKRLGTTVTVTEELSR